MSVAVCSLADLEPGGVRRVDVGGIAVALVRIGDDVYALGDICSHANVSLSGGEVWCDELELECPQHGSTFSVVTGVPSTLPATQPVPVYAVEVRAGDVYITVDDAVATATRDSEVER